MLQPLLSLRTNNFNDPDIIEKVTDLWDKALGMLDHYDGNIYSVYHNYESNYKGSYDISIATSTTQKQSNTIILGKNYREFPIALNQPSSIVEVWQTIWQMEDNGEIDRQYDVDYEEYRTDGTVSIFISLKS
ncbi:effector binding domain-containing protein [Wohlfahrtiimonas larvae]|uniref:GyrI-like domain-containing protein n=1 Tax=Wohlfahrtiimonas larvae TaxID=1157986 RepID=A0ABP9MGY7_9GAMM|nr:effector binding domain-containing protein [Wohlfahrtiimonas larvae]